jgi:hypothetical protein
MQAVFNDAMEVDSDWVGLADEMEIGEDGGGLEV